MTPTVLLAEGINGRMAHLSDTLFTTAIAVYALAMVAYIAEYAFGRVARTSSERAERALVGSGGPSVTTVPLPGDAVPPAPPARRKRLFADKAGRFALAVTVVGAIVHTGSILVRALAVDAVPWSNMYEFASVSGLVAVLAFLGVMWKAPQLRHLGGFILLPVLLLMFAAGTIFYGEAQKLVPALQSYWLAIHVFLVSIGEGALMTSAVLTALYLVKARHDKRAASGVVQPGALTNLAQRLPAAETLDKAAYRVVAFSFPLYTVAVICGAIWAEAAWGRYWGWDPKETWAFIVWVIYAGYLHARATAGWKGRAAAWINLAGFGAIIFNFVIVNLVVKGLHSYAGVS
ncbi:cytochrome c biogenesis protein [Jatrophihabitans fulvus]